MTDRFAAEFAFEYVRYSELHPPYLTLGLSESTLKILDKRRNELYTFSHEIGMKLYVFKHYRVKRISWKKREVVFEKVPQKARGWFMKEKPPVQAQL